MSSAERLPTRSHMPMRGWVRLRRWSSATLHICWQKIGFKRGLSRSDSLVRQGAAIAYAPAHLNGKDRANCKRLNPLRGLFDPIPASTCVNNVHNRVIEADSMIRITSSKLRKSLR
jgi:hypothetical protein